MNSDQLFNVGSFREIDDDERYQRALPDGDGVITENGSQSPLRKIYLLKFKKLTRLRIRIFYRKESVHVTH